MALLRQRLASGSVHPVFEQKAFFVKMVQAVALGGLVRFCRGMHHRQLVRVVHEAAGIAGVGKAVANADGADDIEAVGILHALAFECLHDGHNSGPFEGDGGHNLNDLFDTGPIIVTPD